MLAFLNLNSRDTSGMGCSQPAHHSYVRFVSLQVLQPLLLHAQLIASSSSPARNLLSRLEAPLEPAMSICKAPHVEAP